MADIRGLTRAPEFLGPTPAPLAIATRARLCLQDGLPLPWAFTARALEEEATCPLGLWILVFSTGAALRLGENDGNAVCQADGVGPLLFLLTIFFIISLLNIVFLAVEGEGFLGSFVGAPVPFGPP